MPLLCQFLLPVTLYVGNLDGTGVASQLFGGSAGEAHGVQYDAASDRFFWTEMRDHRIMVGNADGSGIPTVLFDNVDGVDGPRQLVVDMAGGMVYWVQQGGFQIMSGAIDGSGPDSILYTTVSGQFPWGIDIDVTTGTLYWTKFEAQWVGTQSWVVTARADGSGPATVLFSGNWGMFRGIAAGVNLQNFGTPAVSTIPTIGEWGMIILSLGMLIGATVILRRRQSVTHLA